MTAVRVVAAVLLLAGAARATDDPDVVEAKKHFQRGTAHYNLREYKEAAVEFQAAYRLHPDAVFLYNLAQSYRLADDPEQALYFYRAYLRSSPKAPNKREVDGRIADLEKLMDAKKQAARPPDATLAPAMPHPQPGNATAPHAAMQAQPVRPVAVARPVTIEPVRPVAIAPTHPVIVEPAHPVTIEPAQPTTVTPAQPVSVAPAAVATSPAPTPIYKKWWLWTIVGVAVIGIVVGIAAGVSSGHPSLPNHFPGVSF
jgi:hypothetical protein